MSASVLQEHRPGAVFKGVLLDWRGTLVVAPTYRRLVQTALEMLDRDASAERVDAVLARLREADASEVESSAIDTDAALHAAKRSRGGGAAWHLSRDYPN